MNMYMYTVNTVNCMYMYMYPYYIHVHVHVRKDVLTVLSIVEKGKEWCEDMLDSE